MTGGTTDWQRHAKMSLSPDAGTREPHFDDCHGISKGIHVDRKVYNKFIIKALGYVFCKSNRLFAYSGTSSKTGAGDLVMK